MKQLLLIFIFLLILTGCSKENYPVRIYWGAPQSDVVVEKYIVEIDANGDIENIKTPKTSIETKFKYDIPYTVRVVAIGISGLSGPYSLPSKTMLKSSK